MPGAIAAASRRCRGPRRGRLLHAAVMGLPCLGPASGHAQSCVPHWEPVGSGTSGGITYPAVLSLDTYDLGIGPALYLGGNFTHADNILVNHIARCTPGGVIEPLVMGNQRGVRNGMVQTSVYTTAVFDDGTGSALYVGGDFTIAGTVAALHIARWNGTAFSALGPGVNWGQFAASVRALAVFDDGTGPALYAAGYFTHAGTTEVNYIAKWDGASWSALAGGTDQPVHALAVLEDEGTPHLYAAGNFTSAGGVAVSFVASWDGAAWHPLGAGVNAGVHDLAVFDDGSGPALYVGGYFDSAGGRPASRVARWKNHLWSALGAGVGSSFPFPGVEAFASFDDGSGLGALLFVGGQFQTAGGQPARNIARWDGDEWSAVDGGVGFDSSIASVYSLAPGVFPGRRALYVGGNFTQIDDGDIALNFARWTGCACPADYNGDLFVDGIDADEFNNDFEAGNPRADINGDGFVDGIDYDQFHNAFETPC